MHRRLDIAMSPIGDPPVPFAANPKSSTDVDGRLPEDLAKLLDELFLELVPAAPRFLRLLEERGWTGWTNLKRIEPAG